MENLLNTKEVAKLMGVSPATLTKWRHLGEGPPYVKVGLRTVRYERAAIEKFLSDGICEPAKDRTVRPRLGPVLDEDWNS